MGGRTRGRGRGGCRSRPTTGKTGEGNPATKVQVESKTEKVFYRDRKVRGSETRNRRGQGREDPTREDEGSEDAPPTLEGRWTHQSERTWSEGPGEDGCEDSLSPRSRTHPVSPTPSVSHHYVPTSGCPAYGTMKSRRPDTGPETRGLTPVTKGTCHWNTRLSPGY